MWLVQLVNFSVVPTYLQIPFAAGVSFVWTVILSMMRGSDTGATVTEDAEAVLTAPAAQQQAAVAEPPSRAQDGTDGAAAVEAADGGAAVLPAHGVVAAAASVAEPLRFPMHGLRQRCSYADSEPRPLAPQLSFACGRATGGGGGSAWAGLAGLLHLQHPLRSTRMEAAVAR